MALSVDIEGVAGVAVPHQLAPGGRGYERARALMTAEARAAVQGAWAGGARAVAVNDSHGPMDNLLLDRLDAAEVVLGKPKPHGMAQGAAGADVLLLVGYHAAAGVPGVLAHTTSGVFTRLLLNGDPVSEADVTGLVAATHGVPVGLVTGDDAVCSSARLRFPGVTTVVVKRAAGFTAARALSPAAAQQAVRRGAQRAVERARDLAPVTVPDQLVLEARIGPPGGRDRALTVPGTTAVGPDGVRCMVADPVDVQRVLYAWALVAAPQRQGTPSS